MEKIKKLNIITGIVLAGFIIAVIYHFILGFVFHLEYPYNTFLFNPAIRFSDLTDNYYIFDTLKFSPYVQPHHVNYFPFCMLTIYLFRLLPFMFSCVLFYSIVVNYFVFYNYKNIEKGLSSVSHFKIIIISCILSFLSYPFLIMMNRGNNDFLLFIFISLFIYFFMKEKYIKSALMLSMPIAMKAYPIIFIPLFLMKKKYKESFYCILSVLFLTVISLALTNEPLLTNLHWFARHMEYYKNTYIIHNGSMWGISLFSIVKFFIFWANGCIKLFPHYIDNLPFQFNSFIFSCDQSIFALITKALKIYMPLAILSVLAISAYSIFIEKEFWKQVLLLFICSMIFPPSSSDGKLFVVFIPLWIFINSQSKSKKDWLYAILFGLILIPKNYLQFIDPAGYDNFNISFILNPLILIIMSTTIIVEGFRSRKNKNLPEQIENQAV